MKRLFFAGCALLVTVTLIYHFFPNSSRTAMVIPIDGAGFGVTWLLCIGLVCLVAFWRMLGSKA